MKTILSNFVENGAAKYLDIPRLTVLGAESPDDIADGIEIAEKNMPAFWNAIDWDGPIDEPFWMRPPHVFVDLAARAVVPSWVARGEPDLEPKSLPAIKVEQQNSPSLLMLLRCFIVGVPAKIKAVSQAVFPPPRESDATQWCPVWEEFDYGGRIR